MSTPKPKPKAKWWQLAVMLFVSVAVLFGLRRSTPEPVHGGKALTTWLEEYDQSFRLGNSPPEDAARDAIRAIGTNALPLLLQRITANDPFGVKRSVQKATGGSAHPAAAPEARAHLLGICGFAALGEIAQPALADLVKLLGSERPRVRLNATYSLGYLGAAADPAIPALVARMNDEDRESSAAAVWALGNLRLQADVVIPALVPLLGERYPSLEVFGALKKFGSRAGVAIPRLRELALARDPGVGLFAVETLEQIDPAIGAEYRSRLRSRKLGATDQPK